MKTLLPLITLLLLLSCSEQKGNKQETSSRNIDTTFFKADGFNMGLELALLSNNKFVLKTSMFSCFGGGEIRKFAGSYSKDQTQLKLKPETVTITVYTEESPMSNPEIRELQYGPDSLKTKTIFQILEWNNNEYLLSEQSTSFYGFEDEESDYENFAYYYNSGDEPEEHGWYLVNEAVEKDSATSSLDLDKIPPKYRGAFLKQPIAAEITNTEKVPELEDEGEHWLITINKGEVDGVNKSLIFRTQNSEFFIEPDSVFKEKTVAKSYMYKFSTKDYPVGTVLKTKWED
ncbi:hypothetical protein RM545_10230 [Zunongwangia sp. F260]|uniref:Uncharacterized protein n=1 Tax=Autumnicola lenta TaxID=3075593 RepID=A0ABU3CL48_9FLAO|nr:hypothetical protein [Zunongwangia sp. F260]MDT0647069.1 hypothetical protein [Zunongwangia sp. F260]